MSFLCPELYRELKQGPEEFSLPLGLNVLNMRECWDEWVSCTQCKLGVRMQVIFNRCGMKNTNGNFSEEWKFD